MSDVRCSSEARSKLCAARFVLRKNVETVGLLRHPLTLKKGVHPYAHVSMSLKQQQSSSGLIAAARSSERSATVTATTSGCSISCEWSAVSMST